MAGKWVDGWWSVCPKALAYGSFQVWHGFVFSVDRTDKMIQEKIKDEVMKQNMLSLAKTAMKHFFDIDPVLTEHLVYQTAAQVELIQHEVASAFQHNVQQSKAKIIQLVHPHPRHNWNAA